MSSWTLPHAIATMGDIKENTTAAQLSLIHI